MLTDLITGKGLKPGQRATDYMYTIPVVCGEDIITWQVKGSGKQIENEISRSILPRMFGFSGYKASNESNEEYLDRFLHGATIIRKDDTIFAWLKPKLLYFRHFKSDYIESKLPANEENFPRIVKFTKKDLTYPLREHLLEVEFINQENFRPFVYDFQSKQLKADCIFDGDRLSRPNRVEFV